MKKYLIAVLLTACLLFSFGTTAFADPSGGQTPNTDGASNSVTQNEETYTMRKHIRLPTLTALAILFRRILIIKV